ncbi:MAG: phosphate ABC transporter substrate-binding protein PstS [Solirubrobacteraceae bacterium]
MTVAALAIGVSGAFTAGAVAQTTTLNGAGSTLVAPLEAEWANSFAGKTGITVNYNAVGSGTGITDISQGTVDFGASDAPLNSTQAAGCANCIQIPWALSATGVGFNVPGVRKLKLTGSVLAGIYLGQITNWDTPQIAKLNKGVRLPNLQITPIYRSDGSGDTYAFTNYLNDVSSAWASGPGYGTLISFPHGVGDKGNSGVTAALQSTSGAIAYVAVSYLIAHGVPAVAIQNAAGKYEYPNLANIENAAAIVKHVPGGTPAQGGDALHIVDPPKSAKIAYPISTFTYVIAPTTAPNGSELKEFIQYALGPGQAFGASLDFAPLPKVVLNADKAAVNQL